MKELQTRRFTEQIEDILKSDFSQKLIFNKEIVTSAKVNTKSKLTTPKINALMAMSESWDFDKVEISRSGAGLKIEFLEFNKAKAASKTIVN